MLTITSDYIHNLFVKLDERHLRKIISRTLSSRNMKIEFIIDNEISRHYMMVKNHRKKIELTVYTFLLKRKSETFIKMCLCHEMTHIYCLLFFNDMYKDHGRKFDQTQKILFEDNYK